MTGGGLSLSLSLSSSPHGSGRVGCGGSGGGRRRRGRREVYSAKAMNEMDAGRDAQRGHEKKGVY
jgi:hypothetical protein